MNEEEKSEFYQRIEFDKEEKRETFRRMLGLKKNERTPISFLGVL